MKEHMNSHAYGKEVQYPCKFLSSNVSLDPQDTSIRPFMNATSVGGLVKKSVGF